MRKRSVVWLCAAIAVHLSWIWIARPIQGQTPEPRIVASADGSGTVVHSAADSQAATAELIPDGSEVWLHGSLQSIDVGDWGLVDYGPGQRGFVALSELKDPSPQAEPPTEAVEPEPKVRREADSQEAPSRRPSPTASATSTVPQASSPIPAAASPPGVEPSASPRSASKSGVEQATGVRRQAADKHPKLNSRLAALDRISQERGSAVALDEARSRGLKTKDNRVRVVIETSGGNRAGVISSVTSNGGQTEAQYRNLVQAVVPVSALKTLATRDDVVRIAPPAIPIPLAVTGEEIVASGANTWHGAGLNGAGVKVGVIDLGFGGLAARQAAGDLPANVVIQDFCSGGFNGPEDHGVGVAEIVHEMAPSAQLYLLCIDTQVQLGQAKEYAKAQGIHIINHSVGWFNSSRGDGSGGPGTPDAIVKDARNSGILWVNSAGNEAQEHWSGSFNDTDGDGFHNFTPNDQGITYAIASGSTSCVFLKWDNWPASAQDFDLILAPSAGGSLVAISDDVQNGTQPPSEALCLTNSGASQNFAIYIENFSATQTPRFDLFKFGGGDLQYQTAAGSVLEPATAPESFTVGAICWQNNALESFSSQGPTIDGRIKPDIAGHDAMSNGTYGSFTGCGNGSGFTGTSASAPTVAGAAALVKQANPSFTPAQLQSFLEGRAIDQGTPGRDNQFGSGRLNLGAPPCPTPRPDLPRTVTPVSNGRVQVQVTAGHGPLSSITATKLTNAQVELPGGTLTSNGQSRPLDGSSVTFFVQRTAASGAYTAEITVADGCGAYPLFLGAGS